MARYTKEIIKRINQNVGRNKYWLMWIKQTDMKDGYFKYEVYYITKKYHEDEVREFWVKNRERNGR